MPMRISFNDTFGRMLHSAGLKNGAELSRALNIAPQAISNYKRHDNIPSKLVARFAERFGVSMDWLITGTGAVYRRPEGLTQETKAWHQATARATAISAEELLYVERLIRILRSPEVYAAYSIKASLDALFAEAAQGETPASPMAEPPPAHIKIPPKRDNASS